MDSTLKDLSNGMWNSKIRYTDKKLWPFEVGMSAQWADPPERAQSGWPNSGQFFSLKVSGCSHSSPISIINHS